MSRWRRDGRLQVRRARVADLDPALKRRESWRRLNTRKMNDCFAATSSSRICSQADGPAVTLWSIVIAQP